MAKKKKPNYRERSKRISKERRLRVIFSHVSHISIIITLLVLATLGTWLELSGRVEKFQNYIIGELYGLSSNLGLNLEFIYYNGINEVTEEELLSYLPVAEKSGYILPILTVSIQDIKFNLENIGWVKTATVERKLPDTIVITIKERTPAAIWQYKGVLQLIDAQGVIITRQKIERFSYLPIIVGEDANSFFESIYTFMAKEPELLSQVVSIVRIGGRRWNIHLKHDIEIKLPEHNPDIAWHKLAELQWDKHILDRKIKSIDMRLEDRIFIEEDESD